MRVKGRIDANQNEIVDGLRKVGASVAITSGLGKGFPDLVVGFRERNYLLELKDGTKPPSQRKLTEDETRFFRNWRGQVHLINSLEEAIKIITA